MIKTTLYLPEDLKTYVEDRARETGDSEAAVIRGAILFLAEAHPINRNRPRSIGAGASDNVQGRNFDEWFAANRERDW